MEKLRHLFAIVLLLVNASFIAAQNVGVEEYHQENGLPTDLIKAFEIDSAGYLWVATDGGVVRFEGNEFVAVENIERSSNYYKSLLFSKKFGFLAASDDGLISISSKEHNYAADYTRELMGFSAWPDLSYAKTLYEASDSSIWIATNLRIAQLTTDTIVTYELPAYCHTNHYVRNHKFFELDSLVYVMCQNGGLFKLNSLSGELELLDWKFAGTEVFALQLIENNKVLVGVQNGLVLLEFDSAGTGVLAKELDFPYSVSHIEPAADGVLYLGTWSQGLFKAQFDHNQLKFEHMALSAQKTINDVLIDKQNQLWLATNFGVTLLRNLDFKPAFTDYTKYYIHDMEAVNGKLYFTDGWRVAGFNPQNKTLHTVFSQWEYLIHQFIIKNNDLWVATDDGRIIVINKGVPLLEYDFSAKGGAITELILGKDGLVWFIQNRKKPTVVSFSSDFEETEYVIPLPDEERLRMLKIAADGTLYLGASGIQSYLWRFNSDAHIFENISIPIKKNKNTVFEVNDMEFYRSNVIVLGTSEGIWKYSPLEIKQFNLGEMNQEHVTSVAVDSQERIWFGNSNGLILWDSIFTITFNNYDGIPSKTNSFRNLHIDEFGQIWMGTNLGMVEGTIKETYKCTPKPKIRHIENEYRILYPDEHNSFLVNTPVHITFSNSQYPAKYVSFEYRLVNSDNEHWVAVQRNSRSIVLTNLPDGSYKLQLRAKGKGFYKWSEPETYEFTIYKKWYQKVWVLTLIYIGIVVSLIIYLRLASKKSERERKKLEAIISQRTQDLKEQNEELTQLNSNLKSAKDEAEAAIKSKDRFFSILAHDLKSPFNTLIGFSQLLVNNRNDISEAEMQQFLEEMLQTSENTYKLLQNLLEWARSQTGVLQIERKQIVLKPFINEVLATITATANQKDIGLLVEVPDTLEIYADKSIMATVFRNLVLNAIKFSYPHNVVKVKAELVDELWTDVMIIDNGVGIEKDILPNLFSLDKNVSSLGTAQEKGTGLGLILCKEFVEKSGGTIKVDSKPGIGSTFVIRLPRRNFD
jgi:signal transduction histidine kinase/ligand-binding sensor domain-containing protein